MLEDGRVENSVPCDVLYIKELAVNLLSVSATANKGVTMYRAARIPVGYSIQRVRSSAVELSRATCGRSWYVQLLTQQLWPTRGRS